MILLRADVTPLSGLSHVRRCAYLAALLKKGPGARLACREDKRAAKFLAEAGVPFVMAQDPGKLDMAGAGAVIFDLGEFSAQDAALLERATKGGLRTVQLVPAGGRPQPVDLAFPLADAANALLHHKFRHFHKAARRYRRRPRLLFVNLGDALPYRELRGIVDVLHRQRFLLKVNPGAGLKKADKRNLMRIYPGIHFRGRSESTARAYFEADLALIPPGEEALEAACVGTPALYLPAVPGQEAQAAAWAGLGIGAPIPYPADFSPSTVGDAVAPLDQGAREKMGAAAKALVDGLGVQRFMDLLRKNGIIE